MAPKVAKVKVYWEGDSDDPLVDSPPYEMSRKEFKDALQGAFTAHLDRTVDNKEVNEQ